MDVLYLISELRAGEEDVRYQISDIRAQSWGRRMTIADCRFQMLIEENKILKELEKLISIFVKSVTATQQRLD